MCSIQIPTFALNLKSAEFTSRPVLHNFNVTKHPLNMTPCYLQSSIFLSILLVAIWSSYSLLKIKIRTFLTHSPLFFARNTNHCVYNRRTLFPQGGIPPRCEV